MKNYAVSHFGSVARVIAVVLFVLSGVGCEKKPDIQLNSKEGSSTRLFVGDRKEISNFKESLNAHDKYWTHIHVADEYSKNEEFGKAEIEYYEAIKASRGHGDEWMARAGLKDLYIKSGQLGKALSEIEWLINNTGRVDVIQKLNVEKERILSAQTH